MLRRVFLILVLLLVAAGLEYADAELNFEKKFMLNIKAGARQAALNPTYQPWVISRTYSGAVGIGITEDKMLIAELDYSMVYNNAVSEKVFKIGRENATEFWKNSSLVFIVKHHFIGNTSRLPYFTLGAGLSFWSIHNNQGGMKLQVPDGSGNIEDYSATELVLSAGAGYEWFVSPTISLALDARLNYLSGLGAKFADSINDIRSRAYGDIKLSLSYYFNLEKGEHTFSYDAYNEVTVQEQEKLDTDNDGVEDVIDLCPDTPIEARGSIDEYGCPLDSDADGVPDYRDKCPYTYSMLNVDSLGCPPDSDNDSVADTDDDCPETPPGYPVDENGCPAMDSIFAKRTLHVNFTERGIDFKSIIVLDSISLLMHDFPQVTVQINTYTDNTLTPEESRVQSEAEARKIKSYLVSRRISGERIETFGKGAVNFVDTNSTPEGRRNNHRIEIIFSY